MITKANSGRVWLFVQWLVHFAVIAICVGAPVPGVNESHYLPKAKHSWDSDFAPNDLFLSSHDSHLLASKLAGVISSNTSLERTAWIGRLLSWALFAAAWIRLGRSIGLSSWISPFALGAWFLAMHYGHWAGEWAIGGFEAKTIAYPFVLFGIADAVQRKWQRAWVLLAIAVAWHPLAGGWAGLTVGIAWLIEVRRGESTIRSQLPWLALGVAIGLIGVWPAFSGIGGADRVGKVVASQVHVYYRLAHHMSPRTFAAERHWAAVVSLVLLSVATVAYFAMHRKGKAKDCSGRILLVIAWSSVAIALVGLGIDSFLSVAQPSIASKLLRFYWFRWADVVVPLAWTLVSWSLLARSVELLGISNSMAATKIRTCLCIGAAAGVTVFVVLRFLENQQAVPEGDRLLVEAVGPFAPNSDRLADWQNACSWVRENSPHDSLWLTPKHQQTFKWYAGRAEVVCWKDVPQDNPSVFEWFSRVQNCEPPHYNTGGIAAWQAWQLRLLHDRYKFGWLLVDNSVQNLALPFEQVYPANVDDNPSFSVFKID